MHDQLIFVCGNTKGSLLFDALAPHYESAHYVDATPHLLTRVGTAASARLHLGREWNLVNRRFVAESVWRRIQRLPPARRRSVVFWDAKFVISERWRRVGTLSVITDVAMTPEYFRNPPLPDAMAKQFQKDWDVLFETCDHVLTLSEWAAEENRRLHPRRAEKVARIGWGPNTPPLPPDLVFRGARDDRAVSIGHDFQRKGMAVFNEVARAARPSVPDTEWLVAGDPHAFDVRMLDAVTVLPPQSADGVSELMRSARLYFLLSWFEPSAHVVAEAQSNGLPVICSTRGGSAEAIVEGVTGYAVDPGDVPAIVHKAMDLLLNEAKRDQFARAAYDHASRHLRWTNVADAVVAATG